MERMEPPQPNLQLNSHGEIRCIAATIDSPAAARAAILHHVLVVPRGRGAISQTGPVAAVLVQVGATSWWRGRWRSTSPDRIDPGKGIVNASIDGDPIARPPPRGGAEQGPLAIDLAHERAAAVAVAGRGRPSIVLTVDADVARIQAP